MTADIPVLVVDDCSTCPMEETIIGIAARNAVLLLINGFFVESIAVSCLLSLFTCDL
jgi:hypothetical protein